MLSMDGAFTYGRMLTTPFPGTTTFIWNLYFFLLLLFAGFLVWACMVYAGLPCHSNAPNPISWPLETAQYIYSIYTKYTQHLHNKYTIYILAGLPCHGNAPNPNQLTIRSSTMYIHTHHHNGLYPGDENSSLMVKFLSSLTSCIGWTVMLDMGKLRQSILSGSENKWNIATGNLLFAANLISN